MLNFKHAILPFLALMLIMPFNAQAKEDKSLGLYLNLSSTNTVTAGHAFAQTLKMQKRGHPIAIFLNGGAIMTAVKGVPHTTFQGKSLQVWLNDLKRGGAKVIVCRVCMGVHKITKADLIDGVVMGSADVVSEYLFDPKYRVISW
jgi:predicted peroxiredoxin